MKDVTKEFESEQGIEILPKDFEELTGGEAVPILEWASRRLEIVHGTKNGFWKGVQDNLDGLRGWIEGNAGKLQGKTIRVISGVVLAAILMTACGARVPTAVPDSQPGRPTVTQVAPPVTPTETQIPPTPTPEATATATETAPADRLLQLNYSREYIDKFTNIHASTTELYGNGISFESITATDANGKEVVLAVKWGIPELKKEGVWLQHYKVGRFEILMSPQINGYIDTSKLTEASANAFVKDYLARSKALTGDSRYDNVINNKGDVIVIVGSADDSPFPGSGFGSVYLDNGNVRLYRSSGGGSSGISTWFPEQSNDIVCMTFVNAQLLNNAYENSTKPEGPRGIYINTSLVGSSGGLAIQRRGAVPKTFDQIQAFGDYETKLFYKDVIITLTVAK